MSATDLREIRVDPSINKGRVIQKSQPQEQKTDETVGNNSSQNDDRSSWFRSILEGGKEGKNNQPKEPMIPKVADKLKENGNEECYNPLVVSIGPHHYLHRDNKLSEVETLKVPMACQFIKHSGKRIEDLYSEVEKLTQEARGFYSQSSIEGFDDEQFARMMFLDGCFILQFINCVTSNYDNLEMSDQQVADVKRDLLLLENQLPFPVLQSLMSLKYGKDQGMKLTCDFLVSQILQPKDQPLIGGGLLWSGLWLLLALTLFAFSFALLLVADNPGNGFAWGVGGCMIAGIVFFLLSLCPRLRLPIFKKIWQAYGNPERQAYGNPKQQPAHLLELLHSIFVCSQKRKGKPSPRRRCHDLSSLGTCLKKFIRAKKKSKSAVAQGSRGHYLYYSAKDLKKVGIHFAPSRTSALKDVKFKPSYLYGTLELPSITIDVSTKSILFNLVAYETSAALEQLWVSSYICFMDSLIDNADDVKELRSKGILNNFLGADQQVADLFNHMGSSLKPDNISYNDVKRDINNQCDSVMKKWVAEWQQTYFSSPWVFIAFAAAAVGLALTGIQTRYAYIQTGYADIQAAYACIDAANQTDHAAITDHCRSVIRIWRTSRLLSEKIDMILSTNKTAG